MMDKLTDLYSDFYDRVKRWITSGITLIVVGVLLFAYLSNVSIDEGTAEMYRTLDIVFYVFCALLPVAVAGAVFLIVVARKRKQVYLSRFNESKLNKHINAFDIILTIAIGLFCLLCIYPIFYVLIGSFNQGADYAIGGVWLAPRLFTFENYRVVVQNSAFWHSYMVTIARTVIGTFASLVFTSIVAYAMSRPNLKFRRTFYWINLFTMFFGGGLVPFFLVIQSIGLFDTFWVYIIPSLYSVYNMIVISSFFKSVSNELHEAAQVDGAGEFRIWWQIYMPLSKPVLATVALWLAVGHWNSYFDTMIYTNSKDLHTLQYFLLKAIQSSTMTEGLPETMMQRVSPMTISLAAIIISIIPVLFFFPFVRKNFQSGIMIGSLKG